MKGNNCKNAEVLLDHWMKHIEVNNTKNVHSAEQLHYVIIVHQGSGYQFEAVSPISRKQESTIHPFSSAIDKLLFILRRKKGKKKNPTCGFSYIAPPPDAGSPVIHQEVL